MDPDETIPAKIDREMGLERLYRRAAATFEDTRQWFAEEERDYYLHVDARKWVDGIIAEAIQRGDSSARSEGIQSLKRFLGTPDELDRVLEVFCYGWTLEKRKAAGEILLSWLEAQR